MTISVAETIKGAGVKELHEATGIPVRTLYRWAENDEIPGSGGVKDFRLKVLTDAAKKLQRSVSP